MDNSKQYLLEIVDEQKKTIEKYTNKLRDVVAAHKSLLIEKKSLEDTIKIIKESRNSEGCGHDNNPTVTSSESETEVKTQLNSLIASFTNLVAEKSHMEECFKTNQKQLLDDKEAVENKCKELQDQVKQLSKQLESKRDLRKNFREKIKNSKVGDSQEERAKQNQESEMLVHQVRNYEKEIKNLKSELEAKRLIQELSEKKLKENSAEVARLKEDIRSLQIDHEVAIKKEKEKAKGVEEHAKKLTAVQEERVVNLETRLAELSETIGSYDRLRLQDQIEIQKLKEHIAFVDVGKNLGLPTEHLKDDEKISNDYDALLTKLLELKKQLQILAIKQEREEDYKKLFSDQNNEDLHQVCKEEYNKLKTELEFSKSEAKIFNNQPKMGKEMVMLQNQVKNLQEKVRILSEKNKELEKDYQLQIDQLKTTIKNEKLRFKEMLATSESDHKARVWLLEDQLQKQRERSLALLEEKEQEIHALQSTFQMFLPGYRRNSEGEMDGESSVLTKNQYADGPHIVHYANELARRDVEISSLRRSKHQIEMNLRELQKEVANVTERHKEEKLKLVDEIDRLERCQTREGANLEYLKNVVYNFLLSNDPKSKSHMCNAIAAVLKFSDAELQKVINHSTNRWWTRSNIL